MLDELFNLVNPLSLEHIFFDGLNSYHETSYIFYKDIVTSDEKLFLLITLGSVHVGSDIALSTFGL